jgi:diguanylate cyclase (GGDEF)-like protein
MRNLDDESVRLDTLHGYGILDTPREARYDAICHAVKDALQLPYVTIGFFDESRFWLKSTIGLNINETPRAATVSAAVLVPGVTELIIPDTRIDPRSKDSYLVTSDYHVWSYIGVPLTAPNGQVLGCLTCQDVVVRDYTAEDVAVLHSYAKQIIELMETQRAARELDALQADPDSTDPVLAEINGQTYETALKATVSELIFESLNNFGWWAAQAWWHSEFALTPSEWSTAGHTPQSMQILTGSRSGSGPVEKATERFPQPTLLQIDQVTWHPNIGQIKKLGARYAVVLDLYGNVDAAIRLLFLVPNKNALTLEAKRFLGLSTMLLPKVIVREKAREELQYRATHDALTGLVNRRGLASMVASQGAGKKCNRAILFMDLDKFKAINDNYGHNLGDELLIYIASVLGKTVRPTDTVARMGGDEFVIVTAETSTYEDLKAITERLSNNLAKPHTLSNGLVWSADMSIGAALWEPSAMYEDVLRAADGLMYQAKKNGGGFMLEPLNTSHISISDVDTSLKDETVVFNAIFNPKSKEIHAVIAQIQNDFRTPEAKQTANLLAQEFKKLDFDTKRIVLRLPRTYWFATEVIVEAIVTLRHLLPGVEVGILVGEDGLSNELRDSAMFVRAATKSAVYLCRFGVGLGELEWVQKLNPTAIVLDFALVKTLEGTNPAMRTLNATMAIAKSLNLISIGPMHSTAETISRLSILGCELTISTYITKAGDLE